MKKWWALNASPHGEEGYDNTQTVCGKIEDRIQQEFTQYYKHVTTSLATVSWFGRLLRPEFLNVQKRVQGQQNNSMVD